MAEQQVIEKMSKDSSAIDDSDTTISEVIGTPSKNEPAKKKRKSRYDSLDEKWQKKFSDLDSKLELIMSAVQQTQNSKSHRRRVPVSDSDDSDEVESHRFRALSESHRPESSHSSHRENVHTSDSCESDKEDVLSLKDSNFDNDPLVSEGSVSDKLKKSLFDIFGEEATVTKTPKKEGISLDSSQIEVLQNSFRSQNPGQVTSYNQDYVDMFPVDESTDQFLNVPQLDPVVEGCLIKRHGSKGSFIKTKSISLVTQPCKMVEQIAYKGQQAARLGIVINAYMQQSLANLTQLIDSESFDKEKAINMVRDIFSMSTKSLDQMGRAGAFHHIVRRTVTMTDTGLYELPDAHKFTGLPLTGDGLFGTALDELSKSRKEMKKQVDDMLVNEVTSASKKRKSEPKQYDNAKKPRVDRRYSSQSSQDETPSSHFRIPKVPKDRDHKRVVYNSQSKGSSKGFSSKKHTFNKSRFGKSNGQ